MEKVSLVKIAKINMGQSPLSESYNKVGDGLPFFQGKTDFGDVYPKIRVYCTSPNKIAEADDILLSVRAPVGSINVCKTKSCIGRGLAAIRAKSEIEQKYLYHFLNFYEPQLAQIGKGSTFEAVNREDVENIQIPLPNPDEQKRIALILDKADRLRRQRRFAQTLSDSFLQSVFIKMFSEHLNDGFPKTDLIKLVTITGGGTPSREVEDYFKGNIAWLTSKDMKGDYIFDTEEHITEQAIKDSATKLVPKGSILLVVKSKVLMHRLPIAVSEIPLCHGQDIKSIQCSKKVNPLFLVFVLKHNEKRLLQLARGANTEGLTLPMLESIPIPNVPLPLQENFAAIVQKFERVRSQQREATRQAEHLFQTLLHRAFRGEL